MDNSRIYNYGNGIRTDDEMLNKIIKAAESSGADLSNAKFAISFTGDHPDTKVYIILLSIYDCESENAEATHDWVIKIGRQQTYDFLKNLVSNESIDPNRSFIVAGEVNENGLKQNAHFDSDPITVFRFLKVMLENNKVSDYSDFNIDDYETAIDKENGDYTIIDCVND